MPEIIKFEIHKIQKFVSVVLGFKSFIGEHAGN